MASAIASSSLDGRQHPGSRRNSGEAVQLEARRGSGGACAPDCGPRAARAAAGQQDLRAPARQPVHRSARRAGRHEREHTPLFLGRGHGRGDERAERRPAARRHRDVRAGSSVPDRQRHDDLGAPRLRVSAADARRVHAALHRRAPGVRWAVRGVVRVVVGVRHARSRRRHERSASRAPRYRSDVHARRRHRQHRRRAAAAADDRRRVSRAGQEPGPELRGVSSRTSRTSRSGAASRCC